MSTDPIKYEITTDVEEEEVTSVAPISRTIFDKLAKSIEGVPLSISRHFDNISKIITENKTLPQLYGDVLVEIPISTSLFQDVCVQFETHFTPHRKLRQAMLELDSRLRALYAAKDGHMKAYFKVQQIKIRVEKLERELEQETDEFNRRLKILKLEESKYELEKSKRELESALHLVKDAMLKVAMYQELVDKFKKEVEESGLSFEEAEMVYFVMYFTKDAEVQIRTMGRVDTGTFGAIAQLPDGIRQKVLKNIDFIVEKLNAGEGKDDYIYKKYWNELLPKKTGENEIEGCKINEFTMLEPIKVLAKERMEGNM